MPAPAAEIKATLQTPNLDCIHCGICLSACPTYLQLGNEADSPRGRILLIHAMQEGRVDSTSVKFQRHMQLCLECRACETACPSGVHFSSLMDKARSEIYHHRKLSMVSVGLRWLVMNQIFLSRPLMRLAFIFLRLYQRTGLAKLVATSGILRIFPDSLRRMERLLPEIPNPAKYRSAVAAGTQRSRRVFLFEGCIMPELFGPVHEATVRVLEHHGLAALRPRHQACCGALHLHTGDLETARQLARRNIDAFEMAGTEEIVVNAAGCGAMLKEYGQLLSHDPQFAARAEEFSRRVRDICEFLDELGIDRAMARVDMKVTYDDPCHLLHAQRIKSAPRNLLRMIPGIQFVELRDSDRCCGSAGIYNIAQPEMADRILDEKIANIIRSGAQVVATGNPGCLLQIQAGLRAKNLAVRVVHPIELIDQAYPSMTARSSPK